MSLGVVILAAGLGTRMRSATPKVLHEAAGAPLVEHVVRLAEQLGASQTVLVVGPEGEAALRERFGARVGYALQAERLGTGHAVRQAGPLLAERTAEVLVLYAADPLLRPESARQLRALRQGRLGAMATFLAPDPHGYGRVVRDAAGQVVAVVEERDATPAQRAISEVNQGVVCYEAAWLWPALERLRPSPAQGELYLTDLVGLAIAERGPGAVAGLTLADPAEALGVNDRAQLAEVAAVLRARILRTLMLAGVTVVDPASTYVEVDVTVGADTVLEPGTILRRGTHIGAGCHIGPDTEIVASQVADGCRVWRSVLEGATVGAGTDIGPFAHLRPGASLGRHVHIGNYAEVNRSTLGDGVKMGHFSYLGDADVEAEVNIGAGTITANYGPKRAEPGQRKHRTRIGAGAQIGSDTMLVAPVQVGAGARTGAGSVVTRDVAPGQTVVGMPARPLPGAGPSEKER